MGTDTKRREAEPGGDQGEQKVGRLELRKALHNLEKKENLCFLHSDMLPLNRTP